VVCSTAQLGSGYGRTAADAKRLRIKETLGKQAGIRLGKQQERERKDAVTSGLFVVQREDQVHAPSFIAVWFRLIHGCMSVWSRAEHGKAVLVEMGFPRFEGHLIQAAIGCRPV
jgi:hypothetical protein